jgi:hypothetical protein
VNTPEPCCKCGNLYYDCLTVETDHCYVECMDKSGNAQWGNLECSQLTDKNWWVKTNIADILHDELLGR